MCLDTSNIIIRRGFPTLGAEIPTHPGNEYIVSIMSSINFEIFAFIFETGLHFVLSSGCGYFITGRMLIIYNLSISIGFNVILTFSSFPSRKRLDLNFFMSISGGISNSNIIV